MESRHGALIAILAAGTISWLVRDTLRDAHPPTFTPAIGLGKLTPEAASALYSLQYPRKLALAFKTPARGAELDQYGGSLFKEIAAMPHHGCLDYPMSKPWWAPRLVPPKQASIRNNKTSE